MGRADKQRRRDQRRAKRERRATGTESGTEFPFRPTFSVPIRGGVPDYGTPASTDAATVREIVEETATEGRAVLSDHPAVRLGARTHNPDINMSVFTADPGNDDGLTEALPVLLFEPRRMLGGTNRKTGESIELQVEAITQAGFKRWPLVVASIEQAPGWTAGRRNGGVELRDASRGLWARAEITLDPQWLSAAASQGVALAVYGPKLGVRMPAGAASYTDQERYAELREARQYGLVAAGIVRWTG
jgi:hypothetical protein